MTPDKNIVVFLTKGVKVTDCNNVLVDRTADVKCKVGD